MLWVDSLEVRGFSSTYILLSVAFESTMVAKPELVLVPSWNSPQMLNSVVGEQSVPVLANGLNAVET